MSSAQFRGVERVPRRQCFRSVSSTGTAVFMDPRVMTLVQSDRNASLWQGDCLGLLMDSFYGIEPILFQVGLAEHARQWIEVAPPSVHCAKRQ